MIIGILPDLYCCFSGGLLFGNEWFVALCFPSREGIEGCVTVKVACWAEMFLLLFGEEVFFGFGWMLLILGSCARTSHTPAPLKRGDLNTAFCLVMRGLSVMFSPLERGLRGV